MSVQFTEAIGRRKTSTARARLVLGGQTVTVNDKPAAEYFPRAGDFKALVTPLRIAGREGTLTVTVKVEGGGVTGQAEAARLAITRALIKLDPELRPAMRRAGLLTRDDREKERKKPGLKRARKAPTFTKR